MAETFFKLSVATTAGRTSYVVKGDHGELRSSYPNRTAAKIHCAQLNAAFAIGQREILKDQLNAERQQ